MIPNFQDPSTSNILTDQKHYLGTIDNAHCFCASITDNASEKNYILKDLRTIYGEIDQELYTIAGKALQIINWERTNKFCGQCGTSMRTSKIEYAKICPNCELSLYPRISPAIIVAIVRKGKILLARRTGSKMYSLSRDMLKREKTSNKPSTARLRKRLV